MARCFRKDIQVFHLQAFGDVDDETIVKSEDMLLTETRIKNAVADEAVDVERPVPPTPNIIYRCRLIQPEVKRFDWGPQRQERFQKVFSHCS